MRPRGRPKASPRQRPLDSPLRDADRVEACRGLRVDPKEARRLRYRKQPARKPAGAIWGDAFVRERFLSAVDEVHAVAGPAQGLAPEREE